jgi:phosphate/sulfate permease
MGPQELCNPRPIAFSTAVSAALQGDQTMDLFFAAVMLLAAFAAFDLMVGVANDAVNFLNSPIGSRVAPRHVILIIAGLGILAGVTFSSGMMEVAQKGIFHPQFFTMPEVIMICLAAMLADVILLDLFNTFGLPTSTTVSIVFDLLGAATTVAFLKTLRSDEGLAALPQYINTGKAMAIILGILLSVAVAFVCGAIAQFFSRLLFTFDYPKRIARYGALWGGVALASIVYFILVKGASGASFLTPETAGWIRSHTGTILLGCFAASAAVLQLLQLLRVNPFKPIVLMGTFALAMAFAANDLVNFIGVPMAGFHAYKAAQAFNDPLSVQMTALSESVPAETRLLLIAGLVMVTTLWLSRKARSVTATEVNLGQQEESEERFESILVSRVIVRMVISLLETLRSIIPRPVRQWGAERLDTSHYTANVDVENRPSFDLLRASVNLMVATAVISYGTSQKLPLSTTYVTFMVAMATSFADQAWGRESAVYRVTGVLTVVGGWFVTALLAFAISATFALTIFYGKVYGVAALVAVFALVIWKNHHHHRERARLTEQEEVFNLKKVQSVPDTVQTTFEHMSHLVRAIRESLDETLEALFRENVFELRQARRRTDVIQRWVNIITANIFKALRLLQKEDAHISYQYGQTIRRLQKLADGHRDIVLRAYVHVSNHHKGLLDAQIAELKQMAALLHDTLLEVEHVFSGVRPGDETSVAERDEAMRQLAETLHGNQLERIRDGESKTRLSILFYAIVGNATMLSRQSVRLLEIFEESFGAERPVGAFDME